jgi:hypothetical protein
MANNTNTALSLDSILTIVFVILKLTKVIDWSWWWVLSPIWIAFILWLVPVIIIGIKLWQQRIK